MQPVTNIAIIDIGSNSIRIRISKGEKVFLRKVVTTQLSRGITNGYLCEESVNRTLLALEELVGLAKEHNAELFVFATAAVRNSINGKDFANEFFNRFGIKIDILSGESEAQMGILGALKGADGCVIDVGGASSEIVIAKDRKIVYAYSIPLGSVTLTDKANKNIYLAQRTLLEQMQNLPPLPKYNGEIYAIGGTANNVAFIKSGLSEYNRDILNGTKLSAEQLEETVKNLYAFSVEKILDVYKLEKLRATVIHSGALILSYCLNHLNGKNLILTEDDNLEGYYLSKILGINYEK